MGKDEGWEQEWAEEAVGLQCRHDGSADPVGGSEAGWSVRTAAGWGKGPKTYAPSLATHWTQMPWEEGVAFREVDLCG